jgi:hypothetical protein
MSTSLESSSEISKAVDEAFKKQSPMLKRIELDLTLYYEETSFVGGATVKITGADSEAAIQDALQRVVCELFLQLKNLPVEKLQT